MKTLLLFPERYSMTASLATAFRNQGAETQVIDYQEMLSERIHKLDSVSRKMPGRLRNWWQRHYHGWINQHYLETLKRFKPDFVMIYNHQYIDINLLEQLHRRTRIAFLLGDHPLYSLTYKYNLAILKHSDCTVCPDTHFQSDLAMMGLPNLVHDLFSASEVIFHPVESIPESAKQKYQADLIYIGASYGMSSGYKRALFLNSFAQQDLKFFGPPSWNMWLSLFPDLRKHFTPLSSRMSDSELNLALNCAKIYPIDQNQGIINGIHVRVFEAIAAGILPLVEYRKDIDIVFGDHLPVIRAYSEAEAMARYYLDNEDQRKSTIAKLQQIVRADYAIEAFVNRVLNKSGISG